MTSKNFSNDTLRILHLPINLSDERRNELLQKYGAVQTRTLRPFNKYTITFAKFSTPQIAMEALLRLHQLNVQGHYLTVEFAKNPIPARFTSDRVHKNEVSTEDLKKDINKSHYASFLKKLNSWTTNQVFAQPPPPNIRYKYGSPKPSTLLRISIQLIKEPVFYTQVLHLMNRMSLPPPFEELESEFPLLKEAYDIENYKNIFFKELRETNDREKEEEEEEESEIESDLENDTRPLEIIPQKRKKQQSTKRLKIPKFINPTKQTTISNIVNKLIKPEDMFESVQLTGEPKNLKIQLKTVDKSLDSNLSEEKSETLAGGFGVMFPSKSKLQTDNNEPPEDSLSAEFITSEDLAANRISIKDQSILSVFKNYHPGKQSTRLYIKNLSKQVEIKDLQFIYHKYIIDLEKPENEFNIRLMQEGRMKGQAFVTLQNSTQAQLALEETNGFILKDKPMVVQFAKAVKS